MMKRSFSTTLKGFQREAVDNALHILGGALTAIAKVRNSPTFHKDRVRIVADRGSILFEAPTGTGKTLMIGHVAEGLSKKHNILWLWFAPFGGLIDQATKTIRTEFPLLRVRDPANDRDVTTLRSGDVFVTTWASVAVSNKDTRKTRTESETMPSLDDFVMHARGQGYAIGVIIDEAHHSFRGQSQAFTFYNEILMPDISILATATPRDADIDAFSKACGIAKLRRTSISRQQGVDAGLIKHGVKVAVFKAAADVSKLIDFRKTSLRQGAVVHQKIKGLLQPFGVTPLLLVQADSADGAMEETVAMIKATGFRDEQIRSHTADAPDPNLMSIAADEDVEVLVFKMAVATGFDVPRAFTLVSFRPARDPDFGIQIVGRILRVDRRLQGLDDIPDALNYGYVFLADNSSQTGLSSAAHRINAIKNELANVTSNVAVAIIGDQPPSAVRVGKGGQLTMLETDIPSVPEESEPPEKEAPMIQQTLLDDWKLDFTPTPEPKVTNPNTKTVDPSLQQYPRRTDTDAPANFARAVVSIDQDAIHKDIVANFEFSADLILKAQQTAVNILMEEVEIFGQTKNTPEAIRADLAQREIDAMAQKSLFAADDMDVIDIRRLNNDLLESFKRAVELQGIDAFDTRDKLLSGLNKILALRPGHLKRAISEAVVRHTESEDASPLPAVLTSLAPLTPSRLNLYRVFPDDMNSWELAFTNTLDDDLTGTVKWWHRNPPRKPYSVGMPLPGQPDFYPDFIVGIKERKRGHGILLVETKRVINDEEGNAQEKAQAEHPLYKKVMMLYWEQQRVWMLVEYDDRNDKNILDRVFRTDVMVAY